MAMLGVVQAIGLLLATVLAHFLYRMYRVRMMFRALPKEYGIVSSQRLVPSFRN